MTTIYCAIILFKSLYTDYILGQNKIGEGISYRYLLSTDMFDEPQSGHFRAPYFFMVVFKA